MCGMATTTVTKSARCSRWVMVVPLNTLASAMLLHNRIPTSTVCKDNTHGKHAQTERTRRHGQGTCRQGPGMRGRRARTGKGMVRASKQQIHAHRQLCRFRAMSTLILLQVVFVETWTMHRAKHAQMDCMRITRGFVSLHRLAAATHQSAACGSVA